MSLKLSQRDGSASEFSSQDPRWEERSTPPTSCPLTYKRVLRRTHVPPALKLHVICKRLKLKTCVLGIFICSEKLMTKIFSYLNFP